MSLHSIVESLRVLGGELQVDSTTRDEILDQVIMLSPVEGAELLSMIDGTAEGQTLKRLMHDRDVSYTKGLAIYKLFFPDHDFGRSLISNIRRNLESQIEGQLLSSFRELTPLERVELDKRKLEVYEVLDAFQSLIDEGALDVAVMANMLDLLLKGAQEDKEKEQQLGSLFYDTFTTIDRLDSIRHVLTAWRWALPASVGPTLRRAATEAHDASSRNKLIKALTMLGGDDAAFAAALSYGEKPASSSVHISNSTVGFLNAGQLENIDRLSVHVTALRETGQKYVARALGELADAVASSKQLDAQLRTDLLDQLEEVARQTTAAPQERARAGVIKALLSGIASGLGAAGGLAEAWEMWGTTLTRYFGL